MKIFIDTNVLISAFVFAGKTGILLEMLFDHGYELLVSDYVDAEFKSKLEEKWPLCAKKAYTLFHSLPFTFCSSSDILQGTLRDKKDIPVLSDALFHHADIILTGDKDFLEADVAKPVIFSPAMLYDYLAGL